jgi:hypothetical protein
MGPWRSVAMAVVCAVASGAAPAQPVVEKPAASRTYGTARPVPPQSVPPTVGGGRQGVAPAPSHGSATGYPAQPIHARPPAVRPPVVVVPPPVVRPAPVHYYPAPVVRPRPHVGVYVGPAYPRPYWYGPRPWYPGWGWAAPYPVYPPAIVVPPPVVVSPPPPPVYVERPVDPSAVDAGPPPAGYWYWCAEPEGWHPQVADCPVGWQAVPPRAAQ